MQYVICYDVSDDGRRYRLANALLDFGTRVQESVFVANLDNSLYARMVARIQKLLQPEVDRVHIFTLCGECIKRTRVLGTAEIVEDKEFYVV
ncbi:MAG: CRISPR-associated endonuclease Cas2 [Bryobacterales bacterium]|nr:CRISPR-associated endonuclease Cas2 [Bryobacterales bacterium]